MPLDFLELRTSLQRVLIRPILILVLLLCSASMWRCKERTMVR